MAQYSAQLDGVFVALADPTRRAVVRRLGYGPTSVGDLARAFPMTLPSFMKHVRTLESNGLIRTVKSGRVRTAPARSTASRSPWSTIGSRSSAGSGRSAPTASNSSSPTRRRTGNEP